MRFFYWALGAVLVLNGLSCNLLNIIDGPAGPVGFEREFMVRANTYLLAGSLLLIGPWLFGRPQEGRSTGG